MLSIDEPAQIIDVVSGLLNKKIVCVEHIGGGGNSRVFKAVDSEGVFFAVKFCQDVTRLTKEFTSLNFLVKQGINNVPAPVVLGADQHCAVYAFLEGHSFENTPVVAHHIDAAVQFLVALRALGQRPAGADLAPASEACFTLLEIRDNIDQRLKRLSLVDASGQVYDAFRAFLNQQFCPTLERVDDWVLQQAKMASISMDLPLAREHRTLSPSDFGFHNALWNNGTTLAFLDFEHFGWDDPAKLISDFLLHPHPLMAIPEDLKRRFVQSMLGVFDADEKISQRLKLVYPLFAFKWCTILLNEFIPKDLNRRLFAGQPVDNLHQVLDRQLTKAKQMLSNIADTYRFFPY